MAHRSPGGQLTSKTGMKSLSKKMDSSRHTFERHPASQRTPGAFGREEVRNAGHESASGTTRPSKKAALGRMRSKR